MIQLSTEKKPRTVSVALFKESGKYYTSESWRAPEPTPNGYLGPEDMVRSPDFHRIGSGSILVESDALAEFPDDENWGFPRLI